MSQHQTSDDIHQEGRRRFYEGVPRSANPYRHPFTDLHEKLLYAEWDAGWQKARREAEERT